jgi:hypothetical protein
MKSMLLMTLMVALSGTACSADLQTQDELEALMISSAAESQTYRFSFDAVIGQATDNNTEYGVKKSEAQTHQQAHFGIAQVQISFYRDYEQRQDLPVNKGRNIGQRKKGHYIPGICR